jgi:hypothetical protein
LVGNRFADLRRPVLCRWRPVRDDFGNRHDPERVLMRLWPFFPPAKPTVAPSDAARALAQEGARQRRNAWIAKRNARIRELCEGMGKPVPEVLQ